MANIFELTSDGNGALISTLVEPEKRFAGSAGRVVEVGLFLPHSECARVPSVG